MKWFHDHGYGNSGATSGHLIPGYERALKIGWRGIYEDLENRYNTLPQKDKKGKKGAQLSAMMTAATTARDLAAKYAALCERMALDEKEALRQGELQQMAAILKRVPWEPAVTFWEAVQALWLTHMLVMSDENYPGPGVSFGRIDQYLLPYWQRSIAGGMDRELGKEIMKCFWVHANTVYDAMIRVGDNGITAGYGQLITLSGVGANGKDMTNDLTYAMLEVIDEMTPILEPKPNVRLHRGTPGDAAGQGGGHDLGKPGRALPAQLRRAVHGRDAARGKEGRGGTPHQRDQRARLRARGLPGEHHAGQRPLRHGGQQPEPLQGRGALPERREGLL